MTSRASGDRLSPPADAAHASARFGPEVGEPPPAVDPRRWGSLIGGVGGMTFIGSYSPVFVFPVSVLAWTAGLALALAALYFHYVRPVALGPLERPRPWALATYGACVVGEVALIAVGSNALAAAGRSELRPALITAVVGLHFLPFAWAFGERMFRYLGWTVAGLGGAGLLAGAVGIPHAAEASAVLAGLALLSFVVAYARGRFAPSVSGAN